LVSVYDVHAELLINEIAKDLKEKFKVERPAFATFAKTGVSKERAPQNPEWYYIRMASILRRVYVDGPVGVESLRTYYGGRKARGSKPHEFRKASGKIIRKCLQELEKLGFVEKDKNKEGRKIAGKGEKFLNEKAKHTAQIMDAELKKIAERKAEREKELRARAPAAGEEKKDLKKKKKKEDADVTAIKLKKQSKK